MFVNCIYSTSEMGNRAKLFLDAYQDAVNEHLKIGTQRPIYQTSGIARHYY